MSGSATGETKGTEETAEETTKATHHPNLTSIGADLTIIDYHCRAAWFGPTHDNQFDPASFRSSIFYGVCGPY